MNWFRFYHTALDDPKVQRLPSELFKAWVNLLCLASEGSDRGMLPPLDDIAFRLRLSADDAEAMVWALVERGLIDDASGRLGMHNWTGRQRVSDDVNARVRKHRSGPTNSETLRPKTDVTLHETETKRSGNGLDTDTDTEQSAAAAATRPPARKPLLPAPQSIYADTLNGALPKLESLFQDVDKQFNAGWLAKELAAAAAVVGPLSRKQLGDGLTLVLAQLKRQMDAGKVTSPRPFAHRLIVDFLTEQRDEHHAA